MKITVNEVKINNNNDDNNKVQNFVGGHGQEE